MTGPTNLTAKQAYSKGWRASGRAANLDGAERRFLSRYGDDQYNAWMDGYMDMATGRERGHLTTCTDREWHLTCGAR